MEKQIVEQIKKYIAEMKGEEGMKDLRKAPYVRGYKACCDDIQRIIDFAESLKVPK